MPAPTYVDKSETAVWDTTTTPRSTGSLTAAVGDVIVALGGASDASGANNMNWTGSGVTLTLQQDQFAAGTAEIDLSAGVVASAGNVSGSLADVQGSQFGGVIQRFSGSDGVGASGEIAAPADVASGVASSFTVTTTQADSALAFIFCDWNARDPASGYSIAQINGQSAVVTTVFTSGQYTVYYGYFANVGAAGSKSVSLTYTGGTAVRLSAAAVEVKGTAGGGQPTINTQPSSTQVPELTRAVFATTATASGGSLTYQWQDNRSGSFANITDGIGATSATYVTDFLPLLASGRQYRCVVTDANGSTNTSAASVTVVPRDVAPERPRTRARSGGTDFGTDTREWWG